MKSNYPRPQDNEASSPFERMTKVERGLGCGCLLLPGALFSMATAFGLMLAHGPRPDGSIGQEPERPLKVLLALGFVLVTVLTGIPWASGGIERRAAALVLGGWMVMAASIPWIVGTAGDGSAPLAWMLGMIGLLIFLHGLRLNRRALLLSKRTQINT